MIMISNMLTLKTFILSTAVLCSVAFILRPLIIDFTLSDIPLIWTFILSCLKPPYLYLIINSIIITILASSKLHSPSPQGSGLVINDSLVSVHPESLKVSPVLPPEFSYDEFLSVDKVADDPVMREAEAEFGHGVKGSKYDDLSRNVEGRISEAESVNVSGEMKGKDGIIISGSLLIPVGAQHSVSSHKPPSSTRFAHRKPTPQGGKALGVLKTKRHETLETTWKTITEGRPMPLNRHLRKSDTWETNNRPRVEDKQRMGKSETFNDRSTARRTNNSVLRKEASLSQDDLNRRVEAFINKVNEDMRLQREESLNNYMEMINRGAH